MQYLQLNSGTCTALSSCGMCLSVRPTCCCAAVAVPATARPAPRSGSLSEVTVVPLLLWAASPAPFRWSLKVMLLGTRP